MFRAKIPVLRKLIARCPRDILRPSLFLLYVNNMKQAVDCNLFLYADDSCLVYQHKDVKEIERNLNKNFSNVFDWFVDNKLSIHFGEEKTKCIIFGTKHRLNKVNSLETKYGEIHSKQYHTVTYLGCLLDDFRVNDFKSYKQN